MTQRHWLVWCLQLGRVGLLGWIGAIAFASSTLAQSRIVPDRTLGAESSIVTPNVQGLPRVEITGGAIRGANLFHSFQEFNVENGREAYFLNPNASIKNIFTRVTGNNRSEICGTLGTIGNAANLFLMNPNGIIFGPNAVLNVSGSFVGTTANAIQFGNFGTFSASTPVAPGPILTINPSALLFNQISAASITYNATPNPVGDLVTGLRVPDGRSLLLVGGNVNLHGGSLRAYEGRIELAGLASTGSVGLNVAGNTLGLNVPDQVQRADVSLSNGAEVNVRGANGGSIAVNAQNVNLAGESKLRAGIESGLGTPDSLAGDIEVNATGSTTLSDSSFIANGVQPQAVGKGGNIKISTGSLSLRNGAYLNTSTFGQGDSGRVFVQASSAVSVDNSNIFSQVGANAVGNSGGIFITAKSLSLTDGAAFYASTFGQGDSGRISVQASSAVSVANSDIFNNVGASAVGNSGGIFITASSLSLTDGAQLQSSINGAKASEPGGRGNAGGVNINVGASVTLAGGLPSAIFTDVEAGSVGNGGDINIKAKSLSLTDGAFLDARTSGQGNGGNIIINASDRVDFDSKGDTVSSAKTIVQPGAVGKAGDIRVTTGTLSLTNGSFLTTSTYGNGDGGNITIDAHDTISFDGGSYAQSDVLNSGVGKGGDIQVTTGSLSLTKGSRLVTNSEQGEAGNITIDARDTVNIDGILGNAFSGVQSSLLTGGVGKGGDIRVTTGSLSVKGGARLDVSSDGQGNAGNISINARDTITFEGVGKDGHGNLFNSGAYTAIGSNSVGSGGDIRMSARALFLKNGGLLNAGSFGSGNGGDITINARDAITLNGTSSDGLSSGLFSSLGSTGVGKGGDIWVTTGSLTVGDGANLSANTFGHGNSGNITIDARDSVRFDGVGSNSIPIPSGAYTTVGSGGVGNAGNINVTTGSLSLNNGSQINADTYGLGKAGDITINARDAITLNGKGSNGLSSGFFSTVESTGIGKGGDIQVKSGTLSLSNNALINASTSGRGDAGNISVRVDDAVSLTNSSQIRTTVESGGEGKAGDIDILARCVLVTDGSQIQSALLRPTGNLPAAQGRGGNIQIAASDAVTLSGIGSTGFSSGLETGTDRETTGNAGNITVNTNQLKILDGAIVADGTAGFGNGGNITINANSLEAFNGGQVLTNTRGVGTAGTINLNVRDNLTLAGSDPNFTQRLAQVEQRLRQPGQTDQLSDVITNLGPTSGIFANTAAGSMGSGGSILIDPRQATIRDGAKISVNSDGTGNAGNITLQAGTLTLDNGAEISAQTASSQGGNINLQLGDILLLRRGSKISTNAGTAQAGGDGGKISINAPFIVAVPDENSDITANAFSGTGGQVQINTQGLFGIQSRPQLTDKSDITASSTLGVAGVVNINTPDPNTLQNSLIQLPENIIDANALIANSCIARRHNQSGGTFFIIGNGGLPQRPGDAPLSPYSTGTIRNVPEQGEKAISPTSTRSVRPWKNGDPIVEAQGIYRLANGELVLSRECP